MPARKKTTLVSDTKRDQAYHGYLIVPRFTGDMVSIQKDGFHVGTANDIADAKRIIDMLTEKPMANPRKHSARVYGARKARKNPRRMSAAMKSRPYSLVVNGLSVKFFQGYADDVRYTREADGKPYSHKTETDAAEIYLCDHPTYGHCILIADPSGSTPLWE